MLALTSKWQQTPTYMERWTASRAATAGKNSLTATSLFSFFLSMSLSRILAVPRGKLKMR